MNQPKWMSEDAASVLDTSLLRFNVKLDNGTTIPIDMLSELDVDYDNLESQLEDVQSIFAFYGAIYSELKMAIAVYERRIKAKRGRLYSAILDQARTDNVKLSEKTIERLIEKDDKLNELEFFLAKAQRDTGKLWYKTEALRMKCDNLRSLAGFKKQEQR